MTTLTRALMLAVVWVAMPRLVPAQPLSVLHVKVVVVDAEGRPSPVPRHALLISDSPPTAPPRRILTAMDGAADVRLRPGTYVVESDRPVAFEGRTYQWTQIVEVVAGRDAVLELTPANAEVDAVVSTTPSVAAAKHDPSFLLSRWQDSVAVLWTPASRGLGFVVDAGGLVATNQRVVGDARSVEVQLTPAVKVEGRVLATDAARDVAVVWIDATAAHAVRPLPLACDPAAQPSVAAGQQVFTIDAPLRGQKVLTSGAVREVDAQGLLTDFALNQGGSGGPVVTADGAVVGMTALVDETGEGRRLDARAVPIEAVCRVLRTAQARTRDAEPPSGRLLPVEPTRPFPVDALEDAARRRGSAGPYQMSASDFDVAFITPVLTYAAERRWGPANEPESIVDARLRDAAQERRRLLTDFGRWSEYVAAVPPVLLVRVTPKLTEGFWTRVARGAAWTQGVALPPFMRFKPGFSSMRAFCGASEVTPIHALTIEQRVSDDEAIREGLYVFDPGALGPHCGTVKLVLSSEKQPQKGETSIVDPSVLQQLWQDFAPYRASTSVEPPPRGPAATRGRASLPGR